MILISSYLQTNLEKEVINKKNLKTQHQIKATIMLALSRIIKRPQSTKNTFASNSTETDLSNFPPPKFRTGKLSKTRYTIPKEFMSCGLFEKSSKSH